MQQIFNIPIQLFCVVSTIGDLTPVRFKYETEEHRIITVQISEVLSQKETRLAGAREITYTCTADMEGTTQIFNLKYHVNQHRWSLARFLTG